MLIEIGGTWVDPERVVAVEDICENRSRITGRPQGHSTIYFDLPGSASASIIVRTPSFIVTERPIKAGEAAREINKALQLNRPPSS
ncbi:hypothetical protein ACFL35_19945 [Candidatus Riflebacteria bacterium]